MTDEIKHLKSVIGRLQNNLRQLETEHDTLLGMFSSFDPGTTIHIEIVLPGEYRIGFETATHIYRPGFGSYSSLVTSLEDCLGAYETASGVIAKDGTE